MEILFTKKRLAMNAIAISNFFRAIDLYKKDNAIQNKIVKNLGLLVVKKVFAHLVC
jgi:hypothetical protein